MLLLIFLLTLPFAHPVASGDLFCRACGATLFTSGQHVHGTVLGGPRVAEALPANYLGEGGTVHRLRKSGASVETMVDVAVYVTAEEGVQVGRAVTPPLFSGYQQHRATCSRCGATAGWRFLHDTPAPAAAVAAVAVTPPPQSQPPPLGAAAEGGSGDKDADGVREEVEAREAVRRVLRPRGDAVPYIPEEEASRLAALPSDTPNCLRLSAGWWTFRFCHGKRVEQYHEDTLWSLGTLEPRGARERITSERGYYTSHFLCVGLRGGGWVWGGGRLTHPLTRSLAPAAPPLPPPPPFPPP
jgi:hypothetical protein